LPRPALWRVACGFSAPVGPSRRHRADQARSRDPWTLEQAGTFRKRSPAPAALGEILAAAAKASANGSQTLRWGKWIRTFPGDIAVVDCAREPVNGSIVLTLLDGAFTVKRYRVRGGAVCLQAENPAFSGMQITDGQSFEVWGVITRSIRML
jgi:hypothetical protein